MDRGASHDAFLDADAGFFRRFDAERARVLRRRIAWYCGVVLGLLAISLLGTFTEGEEPAEARARGAGALALSLMYDLPLVALYGGTLAYMLVARPDRRRLVLAVTVLTVLACGFAMAMEPLGDRLVVEISGEAVSAAEAAWRPGLMALLPYFALMTIALLLVPMSLRESLRIAGSCLVPFALVLVTLIRPSAAVGAILLGMFAGLTAPGVLWSRWRHREFDERFRAGELRGRLGEISSELAYARRIHEALFPPQIERGAVRMRYRYEPMREIGGDFLFAHPLAFPPSGEAGALSVVLIDVSGHGVAAALAVNRLHGELRRFFAERGEGAAGGPGELLAALNAYSHAELAGQAMYATALCLRADPRTGLLEWASAGHPSAFVRRAGGSIEELKSTVVMLGVLPPEAFVPGASRVPFGAGDLAVAFTDGAIDALDAAGRPLGLEGVRKAVAAGAPGRMVEKIVAAVRAHRAGPVMDDTLVVEVTPAGKDERVSA